MTKHAEQKNASLESSAVALNPSKIVFFYFSVATFMACVFVVVAIGVDALQWRSHRCSWPILHSAREAAISECDDRRSTPQLSKGSLHQTHGYECSKREIWSYCSYQFASTPIQSQAKIALPAIYACFSSHGTCMFYSFSLSLSPSLSRCAA